MRSKNTHELKENVRTALRLPVLAMVKKIAAERKWTIEKALELLIEEGIRNAQFEQSI